MGRLTERYENGIAVPVQELDMPLLEEVIEKLAHYEELEEAGRLIELPCAVGDTVWVAYNKTNGAEKVEYLSADYIVADLEAGYCIGRTKEEAEAKLKEYEGDGGAKWVD